MIPSETDRLLDEILRTRITILVGHFGSGKTEIAVNLAYGMRRRGTAVTLVDLDIVKPYFRSRGLIEDLEAEGVQMVAPRGVVPEVRGAVGQAAAGLRQVLIDVGGAEVGARVLGSIPGLDDPRLTDVLFVVNGNRPFAETPEAVVAMLREIERVSRLAVRGLVANTHLMHETTVQTVLDGLRLAATVGRETSLPVRFCGVPIGLAAAVRQQVPEMPLLPVERHIMPAPDVRGPGQRRRSSIL
jgi:hypothetical protein